MPVPLSVICSILRPPSLTTTSMEVACASTAFSRSSFKALHGRWMISPAAMRFTTRGSSLRMAGCAMIEKSHVLTRAACRERCGERARQKCVLSRRIEGSVEWTGGLSQAFNRSSKQCKAGIKSVYDYCRRHVRALHSQVNLIKQHAPNLLVSNGSSTLFQERPWPVVFSAARPCP